MIVVAIWFAALAMWLVALLAEVFWGRGHRFTDVLTGIAVALALVASAWSILAIVNVIV